MVPEGAEHTSMLAQAASLITPLFEPLGLGDWRIVSALVSGFMAKETVVSTLGTLYPGESVGQFLTAASAWCFVMSVW